MQSLMSSVDHETRHHHGSGDMIVQPTEETPLLRAPRLEHERHLPMFVSVGVLALVLIFGVIIGIYLLILQNDAENILPPELESLELIRRRDWDNTTTHNLAFVPFKAKKIFIVQTNTKQCIDYESCVTLVTDMKKSRQENNLPFNFLISSNGLVFEELGWGRSSPMYTNVQALVLALIGNFTLEQPAPAQVEITSNFITLTENQGYVDSNYDVVIQNETSYPNLYTSLRYIPHLYNANQS